jgi:hypothetical protein
MAGVFTPMAVAIVAGSLAAGTWVGRSGARWPMVAGTLVGAGGILLTRAALVTHPSFGTLSVTLAVAGLGFGVAVVPMTSAVLGGMPAALSSMAASATNTSRQIGSVAGVAALGAMVNAHLTGDLATRLAHIGITGGAQALIINAVETGGGGGNGGIDIAHPPAILAPIVNAAAGAFRTGLHQALLVSALLMVLAALVTAGVTHGVVADGE